MTAAVGMLLRLDDVDDYLGPAHGRFFASGYRRATYGVRGVDVNVGGPGTGGTSARVDVAYPSDWSRKADADLRPHLSTMDMLVLGAQLSEAHLTQAYGLDATMQRQAWIRKVTLRAGSEPQEELTGLAGSAELIGCAASGDGTAVSTYQSRIGAMSARYEIVHPVARHDASGGRFDDLSAVLGDAGDRYYGEGFQAQRHRIENVEVDLAGLRSTARVTLEQTGPRRPSEGLEGDYQPSWSLLDCFVVNLQLAQIMMYELDSLRRQDSNTLWMVKTVLRAERPQRPIAGPVTTQAAVTGKHLVDLRGGRWREVAVTANCAGVALRASFAHELPAGNVAAS
ncbi:AvrD family protein [Actinoplanes sp. L3-i22]|uniref:AvrD family protein n=1 Tax=Actinoplanes sp. L3-i22 TaxID=2836373 RepID=UPI001C76FEF8|nr:AvrD family protein [Actinoplanes sp. L3-i22]BCY08847.1 hypothetical protein L3i22_039350 [Actinoplanes sp. L3-i22]